MKYKYTKYVPGIIDELDFDQLMSKLSDFFLSSGFGNPYDPLNEDDRTMQALHDAILDALLNGGMLSDEMINELLAQNAQGKDAEARDALEQLIEQIIERLTEQGFISMGDQAPSKQGVGPGGDGPVDPNARFEITDKALDFLGYRALRDLLGATGRSAAGRHDTRDLATGVDAGGASREYEFGDTMNIDAAATILKSVQRRHKHAETSPDLLTSDDLMITQGEFQSSCATVIMLDCSHSMVLYGEDRFTPAKRVALALANMIQHQFPGDVIRAVLFHDSAEEVPIKELGRVKVGPYYTNTREGLRVARRILERQRKDMKQIIMITDGKPSAITRPDGQIYRNPNGLDPYVLRETFAEVAACRRAGIMINTFMLARDYDLVAFVRRVARICKGKAYFTTPHTLGQYVLADFLTNKTRTVH